MRKTWLPVLLVLLFLFGCGQQKVSKDGTAEGDGAEPTEEALTEDELRARYQAALDGWAKEQTLLTLDHVAIDSLTVDSLLVDAPYNCKAVRNAALEVGVYFDPAKVGGDGVPEYEITDQVFDAVYDAVYADGAAARRLRGLTVNCKDLDGGIRNPQSNLPGEHDFEAGPSERAGLPQSDGEKSAQTVAFDFAAAFNAEYFSDTTVCFPYGEIVLHRFGVAPGSDELFIGIDLFMTGGKDAAAFKAGLEGRSRALFDALSADEQAAQYLKDCGAKTVVVSFYTPWEPQGSDFYTYAYEI